MNSAEWWFLDLVCEFGCDARTLISPNMTAKLNLRRGHGLAQEEVLAALRALRDRGLIRIGGGELSFEPGVYYELTGHGGAGGFRGTVALRPSPVRPRFGAEVQNIANSSRSRGDRSPRSRTSQPGG